MSRSYVMPVVNTQLAGDEFVTTLHDVYFCWLGPKDLGTGDARGLSGASRDEGVQSTIRILQALISLCRLASQWSRGEKVPPTVMGVARVPCMENDSTNYGVLFVCVINSRRSVRSVRNQGHANENAAGDAPDDRPPPPAHAMRGRMAPTQTVVMSEQVENMADMLHQLARAQDEAARTRRFGTGSQGVAVTDNTIMSLGMRAFPEEHFEDMPDRSGFCTRSYQLNRSSALALDRVLGLGPTLRLMTLAGASSVFTNRRNYEGVGNALLLDDRLNFRQLLTSRIEPSDFPSMVFPWRWVPGPGVQAEINDLLTREATVSVFANDPQRYRTDHRKRLWALQKILNNRQLEASETMNTFRGLHRAMQERTNLVRAAAIKKLDADPRFDPHPDPAENSARKVLRNALIMREHHRIVEGEFFPALAQLLDHNDNPIDNIKVVVKCFNDYSTRQPAVCGARTADRQWVCSTATHRVFWNIPGYFNHILGAVDLVEMLGIKSTHKLFLTMHFAWLSVFLLSNQLTHLDITGPPSTGKSLTAEFLRKLWVDIVRTCTKVTEGANMLPGKDFRIDLTHESSRDEKRIGGNTKAVKSTIDAGSKLTRVESTKQEDGTWRPQEVELAANVVRCDLGNNDGGEDVEEAIKTRFMHIPVETQRRSDGAIPRVGNEIGGTAQFAAVASEFRVRTARDGMILLIAQSLMDREGCVALRLLNRAMQNFDPTRVLERYRHFNRIVNVARTIAAQRVGQLLFDIVDHSPFYGRPFSFTDLFQMVIRCYYIDVSDMVFAVTLLEENMDDEVVDAIREAILRACFKKAHARAVPRGTQAADGNPVFAGTYLSMSHSPRTYVSNVQTEEKKSVGASAAAAADDEDMDLGAEVERQLARYDLNRVCFRMDKSLSYPDITKAPEEKSPEEQKNNNQPTLQSMPGWMPRHVDQTKMNIEQLADLLYKEAPGVVGRFPRITMLERLRTATKSQHYVLMAGVPGTPAAKYDAVPNIAFIKGHVVFGKNWLCNANEMTIADYMFEAMSFEHAPPEEVFLLGRQDPALPMQFKTKVVKRKPGVACVLPPIIDVDPKTQHRCATRIVPSASLRGDNPFVSNVIDVKCDLHTAGAREHMRVNGFTREDYKICDGTVDLFPVIDASAWNWPKEAGEVKYPPPKTVFGVGTGVDDTSRLDAVSTDARSIGLALGDDTRAAAEEYEYQMLAEHAGEEAMPPLESQLRNETGPADFAAFLAPQPQLIDLSAPVSRRRGREDEAGPSEPRVVQRMRVEQSTRVTHTVVRADAMNVDDLFANL